MTIESEVIEWLHSRPNWQQEAAFRILQKNSLNDEDRTELASYIKTPEGKVKSKDRNFAELLGNSVEFRQTLKLLSIGDIEGINALKPREPLAFGKENLVVIYGNNGSGKSGYVRILKKLCGKPNAKELHPNVFEATPPKRSCKIKFQVESEEISREWHTHEDAIHELSNIEIFDADNGRFYLEKEKEVSYIPRIVTLFDDLVQACQGVKRILDEEQKKLVSKLPNIPNEYLRTKAAENFNSLSSISESELSAILNFNHEDEEKLVAIKKRLAAKKPAQLAAQERAKKGQVDSIVKTISDTLKKISPKAYQTILTARLEAQQKRQIAVEAAIALESSQLSGIGSETWRSLWETARQYSQVVYPTIPFPNISNKALCILCQQELLPDAQKRLLDFEAYIKSSFENDAVSAESKYRRFIEDLPILPENEILKTRCGAAGLHEAEWLDRLIIFWKSVENIILQIKDENLKEVNFSPLFKPATESNTDIRNQIEDKKEFIIAVTWLGELQSLSLKLEAQASQYDQDALSFDVQAVTKEEKELEAKRWVFQQIEAIKIERERLKNISEYTNLIKETDHTAISKKASAVSEKLITEAYIARFNSELQKLGAAQIKVILTKKASAGKVMHTIRLSNSLKSSATPALTLILSDGEKRVVELAAFLADVTGREADTPFIFDDPISSLDQMYEEKTIHRLIEFSKKRQVIVFTHRLSFVSILDAKCLEHDCKREMIQIHFEKYGAGQPRAMPFGGKNPCGALKKLRDENLNKAENSYNENGSEVYESLAQSICCEFRKILERIVELTLLAGIVQRHRREVHTKKIHDLSKITAEDCKLIDNFMTKYSCYEHSSSYEAPVSLPKPQEIRDDINDLLNWHEDFKKRSD